MGRNVMESFVEVISWFCMLGLCTTVPQDLYIRRKIINTKFCYIRLQSHPAFFFVQLDYYFLKLMKYKQGLHDIRNKTEVYPAPPPLPSQFSAENISFSRIIHCIVHSFFLSCHVTVMVDFSSLLKSRIVVGQTLWIMCFLYKPSVRYIL